MKFYNQSFKILTDINGEEILKYIEKCGRTAYASENNITEDSAKKFVKRLIDSGHESVIEHISIGVEIITSRSIANEIIRHRLASYTQSSTRYIDSSKDGCEFIIPYWIPSLDNSYLRDINPYDWNTIIKNNPYEFQKDTLVWLSVILAIDKGYNDLIDLDKSPQMARSILPCDTKTKLIMTANLREWRYFFKLRTAAGAHPDMQFIANEILDEFKNKIPVVFENINNSPIDSNEALKDLSSDLIKLENFLRRESK